MAADRAIAGTGNEKGMLMASSHHAAGVAIITGAAGGMGSCCARLLAEDGWDELLLCDLDEARLGPIAQELRGKVARLDTIGAELTDPRFGEALIAGVGSRGIGALIHTAGVSPQMAGSERLLAINLDATQRLVEVVAPRMTEGAAAVLFASMASYFPISPEADAAFEAPLPEGGSAALIDLVPDVGAAYTLSKRGVRAIVRREARGFGERGARIVSISPGLIDTAMTAGEHNDRTRAMLEGGALVRMGRPEELAAVAAFLCSAGAGFITGTDFLVDGGVLATMGL